MAAPVTTVYANLNPPEYRPTGLEQAIPWAMPRNPTIAFLSDLDYHPAYNPPPSTGPLYYPAFLANDSTYNEVRKLREHPRLVQGGMFTFTYTQPPYRYLFCLTGKGWEIWRLPRDAPLTGALCILVAREAKIHEIQSANDIFGVDAFFHKEGRIYWYYDADTNNIWFLAEPLFTPFCGVDGTVGYIPAYYSRFTEFNQRLDRKVDYIHLLTDDGAALILPTPELMNFPPYPESRLLNAWGATRPTLTYLMNAVFANYAGLAMNGDVVAPLFVSSGRKALRRRKMTLWNYGPPIILDVQELPPIEVPMLTGGIWALPSDDVNAKLPNRGTFRYYSLQDVGAELVEQQIFDFFEPKITIRKPTSDNTCLYVSLGGYRDATTLDGVVPSHKQTTSIGTVYLNSAVYCFIRERDFPIFGLTERSRNYYLLSPPSTYQTITGAPHWVISVTEGLLPDFQKNVDVKMNMAVLFVIPKSATLKMLSSHISPQFLSQIPFYSDQKRDFPFITRDLNDLLRNAPVKGTLGGIDWVDFNDVFYPLISFGDVTYPFSPDMPVGFSEVIPTYVVTDAGQGKDTAGLFYMLWDNGRDKELAGVQYVFGDEGRGGETTKFLVWQPTWLSHSFTADRDYGDILATFGFKVTTIASPPRVEYVVSGFQVCSIWFQNLLKRLRGTELKDVERELLRDCVCSLDGFFGAIRVTFHYDKQTGLIYMREWRLGVPFGDPVPLTTFNLQPYHEIRALKDFWSWSLYVDIIDTRTQTIVKRIRIVPTIRGWVVGEVNPNQPIAFTQRKSFANPLVGVNPSSPYTVDRNLGFTQVVGHNPHALTGATLTNINPQVYRHDSYPTRFYPLQTPITSLRGIPTEYQTAAQRFYGSQVPVVPIQFGNLNAQPIYVVSIPIVLEIRAKRDVPYEIIAKWGVGVAIYAAGTQWATLLPYGLADLGNLLHWTVVEFWEDQP